LAKSTTGLPGSYDKHVEFFAYVHWMQGAGRMKGLSLQPKLAIAIMYAYNISNEMLTLTGITFK
jgi:hypothetical protein